MSHIVSILRAAHCRSTHHYFAVDALQYVTSVSGKRIAKMLLKYHDEYLDGAKAPDRKFRDFKNHVIHVSEGGWGGAVQACQEWKNRVVEHLDARRWKKAAYAAGVLSHYFTDPLMPLHTAQSDRESVVHRPMEWSVCQSYENIYSRCQALPQLAFPLGLSEDWLGQAVLQGAQFAHQYYSFLVRDYDLIQGCQDPPAGLSEESQEVFAKLFQLALTGWGAVLTRLTDETSAEIPEFSLNLTSLLATIDMPLAWIVRKISSFNERRAVAAILQEYETTGSLVKNVPAEVRAVQAERAKQPMAEARIRQGAASGQRPKRAINDTQAFPRVARTATTVSVVQQEFATTTRNKSLADANIVSPSTPASLPPPDSDQETQPSGSRVGLSSDLVQAPSIGPKTAARFARIGIHSIGQFLSADLESVRQQLDTRWITIELLSEWQDQARLVCALPILCGYKAQLLVAAGCRSAHHLEHCVPSVLYREIVGVCQGIDGRRILRSSPIPTLQDVENWIAAARAMAERAA
ncbi:MAG: DUF4332 domain-containing protein [Planctomycetales bacterium]|nr:DUF4332 domain-containing protein [Planctomycetales bacterium]